MNASSIDHLQEQLALHVARRDQKRADLAAEEQAIAHLRLSISRAISSIRDPHITNRESGT